MRKHAIISGLGLLFACYLIACSGESTAPKKPTAPARAPTANTTPVRLPPAVKPLAETKKASPAPAPLLLAKADTDEKKSKNKKGDGSLRLCTGPQKGTYFEVGKMLAAAGKTAGITINVVESKGSLANLKSMSKKKCDAAIIQSDAYFVFAEDNATTKLPLERIATLYDEYVHLICNRKAKIADIGVFEKRKVKHTLLVGEKGSGTALTWRAFTLLDKDYANAPIKAMGGMSALAKIVDGSEAGCMLHVDGLKSPMMLRVDKQGKQVRLSPVNDWDFDNKKGPSGKKIYTFAKIPSGTYKKMQGSVFKSVKTIKIPAVVVVKKKWVKKNKKAFETFNEVVIDAMPEITKYVKKRK